ncbi:MAG: Protein lysine acetyltransferase Pat [Anaerolineales bacterium]|nr:Protein lysine acetyltransferase Pat [Anaerolineales bacterium]
MDSSLTPFFTPRGVAIVGASTDPMKLGYGVARNILQSQYRGAVHFVNPKAESLMGLPMYASIKDVPDPVDMAVLIVPAGSMPQALRDCAARGIHAAIIMAGGFREVGAEGAKLEEEIIAIARESKIRMLGPNCIGLLDTHYPLDITFLPPPLPAPGDIGFLSHSGAFCAAVIDWSRQQGFSFSRLISLGNQSDITETDLIAPMAADKQTRVLAIYIESLPDGGRFIEEARRATITTPIVALKVGRSASGKRAAASHTGALAGADIAYDSAFEKAGVLRVSSAEELFEWSRALAWLPLPKGRRMAVLTNAGGPGVMSADFIEEHGMTLAELSEATIKKLRALLPPAASLINPVDMLSSASPQQYASCLQILLDEPNVDGVLLVLPPPPMYSTESVADSLIPHIRASRKPVTVSLMGSNLVREAWRRFNAARIPTYDFPERAASALSCLVQRAEYLRNLESAATLSMEMDHAKIEAILRDAPSASWLDPERVTQLLGACGIPGAPLKLAATADQAASLARELGFPIALKIASPDILHKSDVGGVFLNLVTEIEVRNAFEAAIFKAEQAQPDARIEGCHLQRMIPPGQEVILGATRDPQFGPLIMFGSGGVDVEGLKDIAFHLAPLTVREAEALIERTWAGKKLAGFRSIPPADRNAVREALLRLSELVHHHPQISEIEINPLRVLESGAVAVDARVRLA